MPKLVEINGLDESGAVGEDVLFVRIGIGLPYEVQVILRNIDYFDRLMIYRKVLKGYDKSTLFKYVLDYMDDTTFDVTIFRMFPKVQLKLLRELFLQSADTLFKMRETLIESYEKDWSAVSNSMNMLKKFKRSTVYLESFVKAYGMMIITKKLETHSKLFSRSVEADTLLVIQIDGGYPFAFWWKDLCDTPNTKFKKGSFVVTGVSNGDQYYPSISTAGAIAHILTSNLEKLHLFPVQQIDYSKDVNLTSFYENHSRAITIPTFQNRILFLGRIREHVRSCLPYLVHLRDRSKTYEPFYVGTNIKWFFKTFGPGNPENTTIIYGGILDAKDKENLTFCEEEGYPVYHSSEFKDDFEKFLGVLQSEAKLAPIQERGTLLSKLKKSRKPQ